MKKKIFLSLICGLLVLGLSTGCEKTSENPSEILSEVKLNWSELKINLYDKQFT